MAWAAVAACADLRARRSGNADGNSAMHNSRINAKARPSLSVIGWIAAIGIAAAEVRLTDDAGKTIVLDAPARRIVSLAPGVTELLFAAGAGEHIVGASRYSDFPERAKSIPRIGDSSLIDFERIVELKPQVAVVWLSGNSERHLYKLRTLGIPVYSTQPNTLADVSRSIRQLGKLAGTEATAKKTADAFDAHVAELRARYSGKPVVSVFYQISVRPLLSINGQHLIDDIIRLCGGRSIFADAKPFVPMVSVEAVLIANPEAIVTAGGEPGLDTGFDTWRKFPRLLARLRGNFIVLDSDTISRQSDRVLEGARVLCEELEAVRAKR
ncbi:MAG TPA: cobalamin-binding protein [Burkholderiales bacterium]|nr:cobalamin-binding protein [Burkholderiales bacterium]